MKLLCFIFALSMTSRIAPTVGKFYVLKDKEGGAYFFEESDLKSQNPTKSYYYMTSDNYKGSGELVTSVQKNNQYLSEAEGKGEESSEDEDQNKSSTQLDADIYGILNKLQGLKTLAMKNKNTKKPKRKLIPGDFQTRTYHHPVESEENDSYDTKADSTFMGLPTSHLSAIMQLLDDFAMDRETAPLIERTLPKNAPHVELNTGIPKADPVPNSPDALVKKLEALVKAQRKS